MATIASRRLLARVEVERKRVADPARDSLAPSSDDSARCFSLSLSLYFAFSVSTTLSV